MSLECNYCGANARDPSGHAEGCPMRTIESLQAELDECKAQFASAVCRYENTIERVKPYIQHLDSVNMTCRVSYRAGKRVKPCGCGLDSLLQAIGEQGNG